MAFNQEVIYTTDELFGKKPVVRSTEELFGKQAYPELRAETPPGYKSPTEQPERIPPMYSPKYWWGAAKKIPGQVAELAKAIPEIPPAIAEEVGKLEMPPTPTGPMEAMAYPAQLGMKIGGEVVGPMAKEMGIEVGKSFYETVTKPKQMIYEKPLEVGLNATILVSAALGTAGKIGQVVKGVKRVKGLATELKTIEKGRAVRKIVGKVPDEIMPDEILMQSAQVAKQAPQVTKLNAGVDLKQALETLGVPEIERKIKYMFDNFHSPEVVLGRHPSGKVIYDALDYTDLAKLNWLDKEFTKFAHTAKGIKEGGALDTGIFKIRDAQLNISDVFKMTPDEAMKFNIIPEELSAIKKTPALATKWNNFLNQNFDYLLRRWGRSLLDEKAEGRIWRAANKPREKLLPDKWYQKLSDAEKEVFDMYQKKIKDYIPHIFNRNEIISALEQDASTLGARIAKISPQSKQYNRLKNAQIEVQTSLDKLRKGEPLLYEVLPTKYRFRFFEKRRGAPGYQISSTKAYKTYLSGIGKKIFDETALKRAIVEWDKLPMEMRPYVKWYLRDFMGWNRSPLDSLWGNIKGLQWIRTLGINPRSAIVNFTQKVNTIAEAGPTWSTKGWLYGFNKEGKALFESTGIPKTIPSVLMEGTPPSNALEGLRRITGYLFQKVEYGNQKHAFLTGYLKGIGKGLSKEDAIKSGIQLYEKTQFRYGRIGMPKMLRRGGGVAFQFWSYPIKQLEFLQKLWQENPLKFMGWVAMAEGGRHSLEQFLGTDLSNALGMGFNYGELFEALKDIPTGDLKKIRYRLSQSDIPIMGGGGGGGIFPYGFGPTVGSLQRIIKAFGSVNSEFDDMASEIEPMMSVRIRQAAKALKEKEGEEYPIYHPYREERLYMEKLPQLLSRTLLTKPFEETRQQRVLRKERISESMRKAVVQNIAELIIQGKEEQAGRLLQKYQLDISPQSLEAALKRSRLTRKERLRIPKTAYGFREYLEQ